MREQAFPYTISGRHGVHPPGVVAVSVVLVAWVVLSRPDHGRRDLPAVEAADREGVTAGLS